MSEGHLAQVKPLERSEHERGCRCGGCLPPTPRRPPVKGPSSTEQVESRIVAAILEGKAAPKGGTLPSTEWEIDYAGDCTRNVVVSSNDTTNRFVKMRVRCRQCGACHRAKRNYWGYAAMQMTLDAEEKGLRSWFGTLTLTTDAQAVMLDRAIDRWAKPEEAQPDWTNIDCEHRFAAIRRELLLEVRRMWARLRKQGHAFKYLLVFERHKSGHPHMHVLVHEQSERILKRHLQAQWPWGFTNFSIVGGRSKTAAAPERAAWYAVKYLSKSYQSRVVASEGYAPKERPPIGRTSSALRQSELKNERDNRAMRSSRASDPPSAARTTQRRDDANERGIRANEGVSLDESVS